MRINNQRNLVWESVLKLLIFGLSFLDVLNSISYKATKMSAFFACCLEIILGPSDITKSAAKMLLKRKADIEELGEKPVIKR